MKHTVKLLLASTILASTAICAQAADLSRPAHVESDLFAAAPETAFGARIGDVDPASRLSVVLTLPLRDAKGAEDFVRQVSDPHSASYGKYLKPGEFAARFGASAADYAAVADWAHANGLSTGRPSVARTSLAVTGDAATIQRLFGTRLARFQTASGKIGFAPMVAPALPAALASRVSGVIGLTDAKPDVMHHRAATHPGPNGAGGTGVLGAYAPADLQLAYRVPVPALTPLKSETVAVFEQGGYAPGDISTYLTRYKLPAVPVFTKSVDGASGVDNEDVEVEAVLDIDMAIALNPQLKQVLVYDGGLTNPFGLALIDSLTAMADDDVAQTISVSYGADEAFFGMGVEKGTASVLMQLAAQGQTVFASTGDDGAYGRLQSGLNTAYPSTEPLLTAVGGTTLSTYAGEFYAGEIVWNRLGIGEGATGGGVSAVFKIPNYQLVNGASIATANGGSGTMRNVPDVSADADPATGVSIYSKANGGWIQEGGTSASSPIWAGFSSIINGAHKAAGLEPLGFINPLVYLLGENQVYGTRDVLDGSNGNPNLYNGVAGYNAGAGYDDASGFGSINVGHYTASVFLDPVSKGTKPKVASHIQLTPGSTSIGVSWTAAANALGYYVYTISETTGTLSATVTQGTSTTLAGLTPGTPYEVFVASVNNAGATVPGYPTTTTTTN